MFSGKTTELLKHVESAEASGKRVVIYKYENDKRYSETMVSTHDLVMHAAIPCDKLMTKIEEAKQFEIVGIDEGQFFSDIVEFAQELKKCQVNVIISALDGDYLRRPFGSVLNLIPYSSHVVKLNAVDRNNGKRAAFTKRNIVSNELELIGGSDIYQAASRYEFTAKPTNGHISLIICHDDSRNKELLAKLIKDKVDETQKISIIQSKTTFCDANFLNCTVFTIKHLPKIQQLNDFDIVAITNASDYSNVAYFCDELANIGKQVYVYDDIYSENFDIHQCVIELVPKSENLEFFQSSECYSQTESENQFPKKAEKLEISYDESSIGFLYA